ncbi:MAG: helix-turn-helix transcriptional regulator [Deltaproteobacteria bacterium]|jgi:ArsR family transcriptional regulator, arsenate/arsenite/antimonite-responsive transcriptional repressor|nr:helix-turn-helix transcriptional regulator [Deltaproteobacteria bacterium]
MLSEKIAAQGFAAVGSESRLSVLLSLVKAGDDGLTVGEIKNRLKIPASTLAHHLRHLADAELIVQEKRGREVINVANFGYIETLGKYILSVCCVDVN